jgi:site-specific DNA recombinase
VQGTCGYGVAEGAKNRRRRTRGQSVGGGGTGDFIIRTSRLQVAYVATGDILAAIWLPEAALNCVCPLILEDIAVVKETERDLVVPTPDLTFSRPGRIHTGYMTPEQKGEQLENVTPVKAALYARVSSDTQQKEGTINSQVIELKRQIEATGDVLVKEYIDDGYSGTLLDRPALNQMRTDAKGDVFDAIYFLDTDRIARDIAYQTIIIGELIKHRKRIIIKGKDYVNNPENKFTVTVLGAVAELERAKLMERSARGRLHKIRMGHLGSSGHSTFGYHYVRKTPESSAALVVNEEQAAIVRNIFEMFAGGNFGLVTIARTLEERGVLTQRGKARWDNDRVKGILTNETYAGTRYFNRITTASEADRRSKNVIHGRSVYRDRADWIAVKVPAIVSRELFDKVQDQLRKHDERYCTPVTHYLLSRLVQCGVCGGGYSSSRRYQKVVRASGKVAVYHQAFYRCTRHANKNAHARRNIEDCNNSKITTHILEEKVSEMLRETKLNPGQLRPCCIENGDYLDDRSIARELARIAEELRAMDEKRRQLINGYAADRISADEYVQACRTLDEKQVQLTREKAKLAAKLQFPHHEDLVDASVRQFCASASARFQASTDLDTKRQFLLDHIERVSYDHYKVTVVGSIPIQALSGNTKLHFQIKSEIDKKKVRVNGADRSRRNQNRSSPEGWMLPHTLVAHLETLV